MADKITNRLIISLEFTLQRNGASASRTISFDSYFASDSEARDYVVAFCENLIANYPKLIQPTNWRDSNLEEEEWETTQITPTITTESKLELESIGGDGGGDGELLPRNITVNYDTETKEITVTGEGDMTGIEMVGLNSSGNNVNYDIEIEDQTVTGTFDAAINTLYVMFPAEDGYQAAYVKRTF